MKDIDHFVSALSGKYLTDLQLYDNDKFMTKNHKNHILILCTIHFIIMPRRVIGKVLHSFPSLTIILIATTYGTFLLAFI